MARLPHESTASGAARQASGDDGTKTARVSVVMATWNRGALLGESIEAMLNQTLPPFEVIVVDDGSVDDTERVVSQFGKRVNYLRQENAGPGAARNVGLALATGDFVQFFDSDDVCTLDKLQVQADALLRTGADVAYSAWVPAWLDKGIARFDGVVSQQGPVDRPILSAFLRGWVTLIPCCLIRRNLLVRLGGYPTARRTGEDMELLFRLIVAGARFVHVPGPLVMLRQHPAAQISAAPDLIPMRIADRVHLTRTVWSLLTASGIRAHRWDAHLWRTQVWSAVSEQDRLHGTRTEYAAPLRFVYAATHRGRQIASGVRARLHGDRRPSFFSTGRMSPTQVDAVRALGYEPSTFR